MGGCREGCRRTNPCGVPGCPDSGAVEIGVDNTTATGVLDFDVAGNTVIGGRGRARIGNDSGGGVRARVYGKSVVDTSGSGVDIASGKKSGGDSSVDVGDNTVRGFAGARSAIPVADNVAGSAIPVAEHVAGSAIRIADNVAGGENQIGIGGRRRGRSWSFGSGNRAGGGGFVFLGSRNRGAGDGGDGSSGEIRIAAANRARGSFQAIVSGNDVEVNVDGGGGGGLGIGVGNEAGGNIHIELSGNRFRTGWRGSSLNIGSGNQAGGDIVVKASGNSFRR